MKKRRKVPRRKARVSAAANLRAAAYALELAAAHRGAGRSQAVRAAMRLIHAALPELRPQPLDIAQLRGEVIRELRAELASLAGLTPAQRAVIAEPTTPLSAVAIMLQRNCEIEIGQALHASAQARNPIWN